MTPPKRPRPEHPVHSPLAERECTAVRQHVLVEAQLATGPQHATHLGKRAHLIRHGAQNQTRDGGIERTVIDGQMVSNAVEDLDPDVGAGSRGTRSLDQIGLGIG